MDTMYRADPEHFAMQMDVFDRMREINAAARSAPVNATRESGRVAAPAPAAQQDALRAFADDHAETGAYRVLPGYPTYIDLRNMTRRPS